MSHLEQFFRERVSEIEAYLDLLDNLEQQVRDGSPRLASQRSAGANGKTITATQQRILYSSVYLQLYNLVEATVTQCIEAVCAEIHRRGCQPGELSAKLRREWVRHTARTHSDLDYEKRLESSLKLCEHVVASLPIDSLEIDRGGGGNWDDVAIYRFAERIGCPLEISPAANEAAKRPVRDDKGALALVVMYRNRLAHGQLSFRECGEDASAAELRELKGRTELYLSEVVASFRAFLANREFLAPVSRARYLA